MWRHFFSVSKQLTEPQSRIKFIPCEGYGIIITLIGEAIDCEFNGTVVLEEYRAMCIVSVTNDNIVNLRQPLPNHLIIEKKCEHP